MKVIFFRLRFFGLRLSGGHVVRRRFRLVRSDCLHRSGRQVRLVQRIELCKQLIEIRRRLCPRTPHAPEFLLKLCDALAQLLILLHQ